MLKNLLAYKTVNKGVRIFELPAGENRLQFSCTGNAVLNWPTGFHYFTAGNHDFRFKTPRAIEFILEVSGGELAMVDQPELKLIDWSSKESFTKIEPPSPVNEEVARIQRIAKLNELKMQNQLDTAMEALRRSQVIPPKKAPEEAKPKDDPKPKEETEEVKDVESDPPE